MLLYSCPLKDRALATSNTTLHNSHETENVTKAVDHKPTNNKICIEFQDDHYLMIGEILQIPLISIHTQTNKKSLHKKSSDPLNLQMTPKFSNKGSAMTPKNSGNAETLLTMAYFTCICFKCSFFPLNNCALTTYLNK